WQPSTLNAGIAYRGRGSGPSRPPWGGDFMSSEAVPPRPVAEGQPVPPAPGAVPPRRRSRRRQAVMVVAVLLLIYLAAAYLILPFVWTRYAHRHPSLEDIPGITYTGDGHPGDPLNVALIGTK